VWHPLTPSDSITTPAAMAAAAHLPVSAAEVNGICISGLEARRGL
jgi:hypothetical protein